MWLAIYALVVLLFWVIMCAYLLVRSQSIPYLKNIHLLQAYLLPTVDIIIAVRNEEAELENALTSVCHLQYPQYNVIVVNDRSTDATPAILQKLAQKYPFIKIITITHLPGGWLGKNHALYTGYKASSSDWILFTDADVLYQPFALNKAVYFALQHHMDHVTVLPQILSNAPLFSSVVNTFALMLEAKLRPWDAAKPTSKASIGVGAFNMVKRSAYEKAGTHQCISLRPDDDLKLGAIIKKHGFKQGVLYGNQELSLKWYNNLKEFIDGLMKNTFSVAHYNVFIAAGMALATLLVLVLPVPVLLLSGFPYFIAALIILWSQVFVSLFKKGLNGKWWQALFVPFAGAIMFYIIIRSAYKTLRQGGIYWRDSFYPLKELKKQS